MNATYIISIARKLGCSIFLLPEDIIEVNQKMILMLVASIMYWSLKHNGLDEQGRPCESSWSESGSLSETSSSSSSTSTIEDTASESSIDGTAIE